MSLDKRCATQYCMRDPKGREYCVTCRVRKWRRDHPIEYTLTQLYQNANRRRKFIDLTLEQFTWFCEQTNYMALKGQEKHSMTIDCIIAEKGYTIGNIQVLSLEDNARKGVTERKKRSFSVYVPKGDCPF